jgi:hypothetical protein
LESELEPELDCTLSLWLLMFADASRRTSKSCSNGDSTEGRENIVDGCFRANTVKFFSALGVSIKPLKGEAEAC